MTITIENYEIVSSPTGHFDLFEIRRAETKDKNGKYTRSVTLAYNITVQRAVKLIVENNIHNNPLRLTLQQFLVEYKNQVEKIEKLLEIETIKKKPSKA